MTRHVAKLALLGAALLVRPRVARAQCTPTPYIVVDGQSCDWTPAEKPLVIPNNDGTTDNGQVLLDMTSAQFTDNYNSASTGGGNLYGLLTFSSIPNKNNLMVGFGLNTTGGTVSNNCNSNAAIFFECSSNCSISSSWIGYYATGLNQSCNSATSVTPIASVGGLPGFAFAINPATNSVEFGVNFAAGQLPASFLITPFSGQISGSGNLIGMDQLAQTAYSATSVGPTAATVGTLLARAEPRGAEVRWRSESERGNLGWLVYRQRGRGEPVRVGELVRGAVQSFGPRSYRAFDPAGRAGDRYWILDVDQHTGALRPHGPAVARATEDFRTLAGEGLVRRADASAGIDRRAGGPVVSVRPPSPLARLGVTDEGMWLASDDALLAAGVRPGAALTDDGLPAGSERVPGGVLFYARQIENGYDGVDAYLLGPGAAAVPPRAVSVPGPSGPFVSSVRSQLHLKQPLAYDWDAAGDDPYIWAWSSNLFAPDPVAFDAPAALSGGSGTLRVQLIGGTEQAHHVQIVVNGSVLGDVRWDGLGETLFSAPLPPGLLLPAANSLLVQAVFDTGATLEFVMLGWVDVSYDRAPLAANGEARFSLGSGECAAIGGFGPGARGWEITDPGAAAPLPSLAPSPSGELALCSPADGSVHRYELFDWSAVRAATVRAATSSRLRDPSNAVDELVIVHPSLEAAVAPLVAARRAQGLRVRVATVEEVDDAFGWGNAGRAPIRALLAYARSSWRSAPRYVLLVGGANSDVRDVLGTGVPDLVPAGVTVAGPDGMRAASDSWYVAGPDGVTPTAAVGRIPADGPSAAAEVVQKILAADSQGPATGRALLASGAELQASDADFELVSADTGARLAQAGVGLVPVSEDDAAPAAEISAALSSGIDLWHYVGHASTSSWGAHAFLSDASVLALRNARLPLLTSYDCLDGMFDNPTTVAIGWAALENPSGGVFASFVPSTVLSPRLAHPFDLLVTSSLAAATGSGTRLGDALVRALGQAAQQPALSDYVRAYNLLGDPASPVPLP